MFDGGGSKKFPDEIGIVVTPVLVSVYPHRAVTSFVAALKVTQSRIGPTPVVAFRPIASRIKQRISRFMVPPFSLRFRCANRECGRLSGITGDRPAVPRGCAGRDSSRARNIRYTT